MLDEAAQKLPGVKVRIGRLSDFADAILAEKADLPVVRGDAPDTWIHGPMSDPAGSKIARNLRPLIAATESLNTQLRAWGVTVPDAAPAVAAAYEQSLLYGEHTWGGMGWWAGFGHIEGKMSYGEDFRKDRAPAGSGRSKPPGTNTPPTSKKRRRFSRRSCRRTSSRLPGAWTTPGRGSWSTTRCPGSATAW